MSKLELKAALQKLDVKTPLKLKQAQPQFRAPVEISATLDLKQTQGQNPAPAENVPGVQNTPRPETDPRWETDPGSKTGLGSKTDPGQKWAPGGKQTRGQNPTLAENVPGVQNTPRSEIDPGSESDLGSKTDLGSKLLDQHRSVVLDQRAQDGLSRGYTKIPNELLMHIVGGDLTRNEIKIALLVARYTISFRRRSAPISKSVIERRCNLRGSAVLEAINGLVAKGVVEKIAGNQHTPNELALRGYEGDENDGGPRPDLDPRPEMDPGSISRQTWGLKPAYPPAGNGPYKKDIYKNNLKISSPQVLQAELEFETETVREYFRKLKLERKRTTELEHFGELKTKFSESEIAQALSHVTEHGVLFSHEPCHSPMRYLATAMGEVLAEATAALAAKSVETARIREQEQKRAQEQLDRDREARDRKEREAAFVKAFPDPADQQSIISDFAARNPVVGNPAILRAMAVREWCSGQKAF